MSERIDVEYFKKHREGIELCLEKEVDTWLKDTVLPRFRQGSPVLVPKWAEGGNLCQLLTSRGFRVTSYRDYQGSYVYLSYDE